MHAEATGTSALPGTHTWPLAGTVSPSEDWWSFPSRTSSKLTRARGTYGKGRQPPRPHPARHNRTWIRLRAAHAQLVAAGNVDCWRCGRRIHPGERWELGHLTDHALGGADYDAAPEHFTCNREAGGWKTAAKVRARKAREW